MENTNAKNIWSGALGYLELVVDDSTFKTWLKNTKALAIEGEEIIINSLLVL